MPEAEPLATPAAEGAEQSIGNKVAAQSVLTLRATAMSWVRVARGGREIYAKNMPPGKTMSWPVLDGLEVTIGNGAGVEVTMGDKTLGTLGANGEVVRRVFKEER
jgi:hypothetical protein